MQNLPPNYVEVVNPEYIIQPDDLYFYNFWDENFGPSRFAANNYKRYIGYAARNVSGYGSILKIFTDNVSGQFRSIPAPITVPFPTVKRKNVFRIKENPLKEIPDGWSLIGDDEIISEDSRFARTHWSFPEDWMMCKEYDDHSIGMTPAQMQKYYYHTYDRENSKKTYYIKSAPRFKCDKPYPYGY